MSSPFSGDAGSSSRHRSSSAHSHSHSDTDGNDGNDGMYNAPKLRALSAASDEVGGEHLTGTDEQGGEDGLNRAEVQIPDNDDELLGSEGEAPGLGPDGVHHTPGTGRIKFSWRVLWAYTGPGWLMSIAYLDPGNLESDLQAGAYTGYQLIWVLLWSTVIGLILQILAARLGVVTGRHLAQVCRDNYSPRIRLTLWLMTELAIIGSDIQEVIGSAIAFKILFGLPLWAGVLITAADTFTFLGLHAFGIRKLEALFAVLVGTMAVCFFVNFGVVVPDGKSMAEGLIPEVTDYAVIQAVSIVGAVIMPHNIYLHSALVQSRAVDRSRVNKVREANFYFSIEAAVALGVSFLINLAVVSVFAKGFFKKECAEQGFAWVKVDGVMQCDHIGLEAAGDALRELLGKSSSIIWAIGLLAAGQSSTMTGTFAGQFVMEGFLTWKIAAWKRVFFTRLIALLPAVLVALIARRQGTSSHIGDSLDEYLNILQSIQLPFALLPILHFTSSKRVMGGAFANGARFQMFLWALTLGIVAINFYLVVTQILDTSVSGLPDVWWMYTLEALFMGGYTFLLGAIVRNDVAYFLALVRRWFRRRRADYDPQAAEAESDEALEEEYDQPEKGSIAWVAAERLAGRMSPDASRTAAHTLNGLAGGPSNRLDAALLNDHDNGDQLQQQQQQQQQQDADPSASPALQPSPQSSGGGYFKMQQNPQQRY